MYSRYSWVSSVHEFTDFVTHAAYKGWVSSLVVIQHKQHASVIQYASIHQDPNSIKVLSFHAFSCFLFNYNLKVLESFQF